MDTLDGMRAFAAVAQVGSFTRAAEQLGLSTALVSKYVGKLEDRLGVRLLHRTTRSLTLTEIGAAYLERCRVVLDDFDDLEASVQDRQGQPRGHLVMTAPLTFGEMYLTTSVAKYLDMYPEMTVDLRLTDRFVGLIDEGVDLAIRIAELTDSALVARRLASVRVITCASRRYLEEHGSPSTPFDLSDHPCIIDTNFRTPFSWSFQVDGERLNIPVKGRFAVNSASASRAMVLNDAGIGMVPTYAICDDVRAGHAVPILEQFEASNLGVYAVYLPNRHLASKVRTFIDFLIDEYGPMPIWERLSDAT